MCKRLLFCISLIALISIIGAFGCQTILRTSELDEAAAQIGVEPAGAVELGYFEEQTFKIKLADAEGAPMVFEPVLISFIDPAHNAHLSSSTLDTDENGVSVVTLTAPDQESEFRIRFSSPAIDEEALVTVSVIPDVFKLALDINYSGQRQFAEIEGALFEEMGCADLEAGNAAEPMATLPVEELPALLEFSGLRNGRTYTVQIIGKNAGGEIRATTCVDELKPGEHATDIQLEDVRLEADGRYDVTIEMSAEEEIGHAVDELAIAVNISFANNPAKAILDGIRRVLISQQPLAGVAYDQFRDANDLDTVLADDFGANSVDVVKSLEPVWQGMKEYFRTVSILSSLELGGLDNEAYPISHKIEKITLTNVQGDTAETTFPILKPADGLARPHTEDQDLLILDQHHIGLGLGSMIVVLTIVELDEEFGTEKLYEALDMIVDCEHVADVLKPEFDEMIDRATIRSGCEDAIVTANQGLEAAFAELSLRYAVLSLRGSCRLADPESGRQVTALIDGEFNVIWQGVSVGGYYKIGPIDATFEGELSSNQ